MIDYLKLVTYIKSKNALCRTVDYTNKALTALNYISYPVFLVVAWCFKADNLLKYILVPAVSFVIVSIFRHLYNAPRPYEKFGYEPIGKNNPKTGKSFPSRHVFSAFIISFMILDFYMPIGIVFLLLATLLGVIRVISGMHFVKDVLTSVLLPALIYILIFI